MRGNIIINLLHKSGAFTMNVDILFLLTTKKLVQSERMRLSCVIMQWRDQIFIHKINVSTGSLY